MTTPMPDPFVPATPPAGAAAEPPARIRKPRKAAARASRRGAAPKAEAPTEAPAPKAPRKPRAVKKAAKKTPRASSGKLGINEIVSATVGLKEDEARLLLAVVAKLGDLSKGGKVKVTAALGKLFG